MRQTASTAPVSAGLPWQLESTATMVLAWEAAAPASQGHKGGQARPLITAVATSPNILMARICLYLMQCWSEIAAILQGCRKMPGTSSRRLGSLACLSVMAAKMTTSTACHRWNTHAGSCQLACASTIACRCCTSCAWTLAGHHASDCVCSAPSPPSPSKDHSVDIATPSGA